MKSLYKLSLIGLILSLSVSCSDRRTTVELMIVETSDVHAAAFPYDFVHKRETNHSLAQVYSEVERLRKDYGANLLLLDNGDLIQGDPSSYYYNFIDTAQTHLFARILNYMKYDAASIGNHDIEAGHPVYDRLVKESDFPWLSANTINIKRELPYFRPYTIFKRQGITIAVLGMITPAVPTWLPEHLWEGMRFEDMVSTADKWIKIIEEENHPDIVIGLFHAGADTSLLRSDLTTPLLENAASIVARSVPGFDVIFVGHDHQGWNMKIPGADKDSVLILGTTSKARNIALAKLRCYPLSNGDWNIEVEGELREMDTIIPHPGFMAAFDEDLQNVKAFVSDTIGFLKADVRSAEALWGPSNFTDLIHKAQLDLTEAQISFTAPLSSSVVLNAGPVTVGNLFDLYRYENLLYKMNLTGKEIDGFLEHAVNGWFNEMKNPADYLLDYKLDASGEVMRSYGKPMTKNIFYNFSNAAGLDYVLDLELPRDNRIKILRLSDGTAFSEDSIYSCAINSYRASGGGGHITKGAGIPDSLLNIRILWRSEYDLRFHLMEWFRSQDSVKVESISHWEIVPEKWYSQAKKREEKLWTNQSN